LVDEGIKFRFSTEDDICLLHNALTVVGAHRASYQMTCEMRKANYVRDVCLAL